MNKNLLVTFENKDIEVLVLDEQILFNPYDVAECLDMTDSAVRMAISKMNEKQVKTVRNADVKDVDIRKLNNRGENFLTESGLYKLIFKSHKEEAERFQDWVTDEVLPDIRKKGYYMSADAENEAIDFGKLFDNKRIRKTFTECDINDLESLFNQYIELSAKEREAKRITNKDRIAACNIIEDVLNKRNMDLLVDGAKPSKIMTIQDALTSVVIQRERLNNKMRGGILSGKTKKINQLEDQIKEYNGYIDVNDGSFFHINRHAFTANRLTDVVDGRKVKSNSYRVWLSRLNLSDFLPDIYPNVDFTRTLKLTLCFESIRTMDLDNQVKAIQDALATYYSFEDNQIEDLKVKRVKTVDTYEEGKIHIKIENIEGCDDSDR